MRPNLLVVFLPLACASPRPAQSPPAASTAPAPVAKELPARPVDAPLTEPTAEELLLSVLEPLRQPAPLFDETSLAARVGRAPRAKGDVQDVYRRVAPATVLIRTPRGYGTGVVISPAGYVLTNHHVVAPGESEDFRIKVSVETGTLSALGVMEKSNKPLAAFVHKTDPLLDLAVVKLVEPPPGMVAVTVSKKDPAPGESVSALGNGGVGLLWAIKDGEISSIGKLATHLAQIAGAECEVASDPVAAAACGRAKARLTTMKKVMEEKIPALVIQSSCTISPGDSGGPLVNRAGELVGLNAFIRSDQLSPVSANFHVHVAEIRRFLSEVPDQPRQQLPDPWQAQGQTGALADADLDGKPDLLTFGSSLRGTVFFDLDQDSFGAGAVPPVADIARTKSFDAELVIQSSGDKVYAFRDADNDGKFEELLVARPVSGGKADSLFGLDESLAVATRKPDTGLAIADTDRFTDPNMKARLQRATELTFPKWASPGERGLLVPDALWGGGRTGVGTDSDRDGKLDSVWTLSPFSSGLLVDADQNTLGALGPTDVRQALTDRAVGADLALVRQGNQLWVFYDTDKNDSFDLMLYTPNLVSGVATQAFEVADGKAGAQRPEFVGLKLVRPGILKDAEAARRARQAVLRYFPAYLVAADDTTAGGLPSPVADVGLDVDFEDPQVRGHADSVVSVFGAQATSVLMDLDRDTFRKRKNQHEIGKLVRAGQFKADFAWMNRGGLEWAFYDTDKNGRYDLVLFTSKPSSGESEKAFRVEAAGELRSDPGLAKGKMMRPSLLGKEQAKALRLLAPVFFRSTQIET